MVAIKKEGKWGYANKKGEIIIECTYKTAFPFVGGYGVVGNEDGYTLIDNKGTILIDETYDALFVDEETKLIWFKKDDKTGLIDGSGKVIIDNVLDDLSTFSEGLACVKIGNKYGFINEKGELVIDRKYDQACNFKEGLAVVKIDGKCGYIDKEGNTIIPPYYDYAEQFYHDLAVVGIQKGKGLTYKVINREGKVIFEGYDSIERSKTMFLTKKDNQYHILSAKGESIKDVTYRKAIPTSIELDYIFINNLNITDNIQVLDNSGDILFQCSEQDFKNDCLRFDIKTREFYYVLVKNNMITIQNEAGEKASFEGSDLLNIVDGKIAIKRGDKWGVVDFYKEVIVDFNYDAIYMFWDQYAIVKQNNQFGIINCNGDTVLPLEYESIYFDIDLIIHELNSIYDEIFHLAFDRILTK